jgi:hypothetical protein
MLEWFILVSFSTIKMKSFVLPIYVLATMKLINLDSYREILELFRS